MNKKQIWFSEEIRMLEDLLRFNTPTHVIAQILEKSVEAVEAKTKDLHLNFANTTNNLFRLTSQSI